MRKTRLIYVTLMLQLTIVSVAVAQKGPFVLPQLPYAYNALEPFIDAQTMEIHHSKHHAAYVNNLNSAIKGTDAEKMTLEEIMANTRSFDMKVRNNAGGHYNHTLFWSILGPNAGGSPSGELATAIGNTFVSFDSLKTLLNAAAASRFGSGWAWLYVSKDGKLAVCSTPNQDNTLMDISEHQGIPILGIDVWEHAYYLKYQNKRGDYLNAIWNVINWQEVSRRYMEAVKIYPPKKR